MERSLGSSEGVRSLVLSKSLGGGTRVLLEEQVGWCALYILLAFVEFSWVPSAMGAWFNWRKGRILYQLTAWLAA